MSKQILDDINELASVQANEAARQSLNATIQSILAATLTLYAEAAAPTNPTSRDFKLTDDKDDEFNLVAFDAWFDGDPLISESELRFMTGNLDLTEEHILRELVQSARAWYSALPAGIKMRPDTSLELVRREKDGEPALFFSFQVA